MAVANGAYNRKNERDSRGGRFSSKTPVICGITSPARCTTTVSPMRISLRAISSSLCERRVRDYDAAHGDRCRAARPASARPCGRPEYRCRAGVVAFSPENLCATLPSAATRETNPSRSCKAMLFDLVHDAIDVEAERSALQLDCPILFQHVLRTLDTIKADTGKPSARSRSRTPSCVLAGWRSLRPSPRRKMQRTGSRDRRIELTKDPAAALRGFAKTRLASA